MAAQCSGTTRVQRVQPTVRNSDSLSTVGSRWARRRSTRLAHHHRDDVWEPLVGGDSSKIVATTACLPLRAHVAIGVDADGATFGTVLSQALDDLTGLLLPDHV